MKLTPNRRMSIFLQNKGINDVLPLNVWLEQLYSELRIKQPFSCPRLLNNHEEEIIWEKIIAQSEVGQLLFKTNRMARLVSETWTLANQWKIDHFSEEWPTEDGRIYQDWALQYKKECQDKHWADSATLVDHLVNAFIGQDLELPNEITLIGFEELTPQLTFFFERLREAGISIKTLSLVLEKPKEVSLVAAQDKNEELKLAVSMAKKWTISFPNSKMGIVVPNLELQRSSVVRVCEEILSPLSFNIAAPLSLDQYALVDAALLALSLFNNEISLEKFSRFLRSPFFLHGISDAASRAMIDLAIRDFKENEFSIETLLKRIEYLLSNNLIPSGSSCLKELRKLFSMHHLLRKKQSATHWKEQIVELLSIMGWPGESTLNGEEIQVKLQWEKLLDEYVAMGSILNDHQYSESISQLRRLVSATPFLPSSPTTNIHVLGILEAVGIPFDHLWITGLHRDIWPLEPAPNPFIPIHVQRMKNLPRSSAARELQMAKRFTEKLACGASQVIFSYPKIIEEHPGVASSLLSSFPEVSKESLGLTNIVSMSDRLVDAISFEIKRDEMAPRIEVGEEVLGGAHLLRLQALCPFRAFAEIRLKARPMPVAASGLTGSERGEIIHQMLHLFWQDVPNNLYLKEMVKEDLLFKLEEIFDVVIREWKVLRNHALTQRYLALEKKRACNLIYQLIEFEKNRSYFEVISNEEERTIDLENIKIRIRIDRVDRLANQEEILIDYKTGDVSISHWFGERVRDPQLPLYCVTREPKPAGIVFSIIRPEEIKFQGITKEEKCLPGVKTVSQLRSLGSDPSWEEQLDTWRNAIMDLAKDFSEGVAAVDPVDNDATCRTCSLQSLCRIKTQADVY